MNIVWLIVDSLSFQATPFAKSGPETMPNLRDLAASEGVTFTEAYAPGPLSPSSHAAMFTGELPSIAGMHEAHPYFDGRVPTIAERLRETHETYLFSLNMWLFQGLDRGFSQTKDFSRQYLLFRDATDPLDYFRKHGSEGSELEKFCRFATNDGKPFRSLLNYLNYRRTSGRLIPEKWGDVENYQYAAQINEELLSTLNNGGRDSFIFANYMDVHPPYDASDEALERFAPDLGREDLPIGVDPERHIPNEKKSYDPELMKRLYRAAIWDFDRKMGPVLRRLVGTDTMVIVTSDHGIWDHDTAYSENRLHVPLVIFAPDEQPRIVDKTVNLMSIPRTIMECATSRDGNFCGQSLLNVTEDQMSVTEIIHHPNEVYRKTGRVDVTKTLVSTAEVQRDLVLIKGDARVEYIGGTWNVTGGGNDTVAELRSGGEEILSTGIHIGSGGGEYDSVTQQRLEDLGYL